MFRFFLIFTILLITSCRENEIKVDFNSQSIESALFSSNLNLLTFKSDGESFDIFWIGEGPAPRKITLSPLPDGWGYCVNKTSSSIKNIDRKNIKLKQNTTYAICHYVGCSRYFLFVATDSTGKMIRLVSKE